MSNFDLELTHRVLLTDPIDFPDLTMSGKPRVKKTPSFQDHVRSVGFSPENSPPQTLEDQISQTMRRAFHDMAIQSLSSNDCGPFQQFILELHGEIRALIPRRTDLHNILSDEKVRNLKCPAPDDDNDNSGTKSKHLELIVQTYLPHIVKAATSLAQLESEDRSQTTLHWVEDARKVLDSFTGDIPPNYCDGMEPLPYLVCSVTYLQTKAQLCQADVADFHLSRTLAPRIQALGVPYERNVFQKRFELVDSDGGMAIGDVKAVAEKLPVTWGWVKGMVQKNESLLGDLRQSEETRVKLVQAVGWVDSILFLRSGETNGDEPVHIPEVLVLDVDNIRSIRDATRVAVTGSALALHASTFGGGGNDTLASTGQALPAHVEAKKKHLLDVMAHRATANQDLYEDRVAEAVVELADALSMSSLSSTVVETLKSRTKATMRGEDPVIKLLDNRMREVFRDMISWHPQMAQATSRIPAQMKAGRSLPGVCASTSESSSGNIFRTQFLDEAQRKFTSKGFSMYASDLSQSCLMATKVIHLMCLLFGDMFLSKMIIEACGSG